MRAAAAASLAMVVASGCAATHAAGGASSPAGDGTPAAVAEAAPAEAVPPTAKIAAPIAEAVTKLTEDAASSGTGQPHGATLYSTPFVKVDAAGRIHAYLHLTALGDEERAALAAAGASIEVAMERLKIVQAWLPYDRVAAIAALPFVARITPPSYASPR